MRKSILKQIIYSEFTKVLVSLSTVKKGQKNIEKQRHLQKLGFTIPFGDDRRWELQRALRLLAMYNAKKFESSIIHTI